MRPVTVELVFCRLIIKLTVFFKLILESDIYLSWSFSTFFSFLNSYRVEDTIILSRSSFYKDLSLSFSSLSHFLSSPSLSTVYLSIHVSISRCFIRGTWKNKPYLVFEFGFALLIFLDTPNRFCRLFCSNWKMCQETLKCLKKWKLKTTRQPKVQLF